AFGEGWNEFSDYYLPLPFCEPSEEDFAKFERLKKEHCLESRGGVSSNSAPHYGGADSDVANGSTTGETGENETSRSDVSEALLASLPPSGNSGIAGEGGVSEVET
ncbi:unnamed protein product, partial [Amoebophrya sp. A25]